MNTTAEKQVVKDYRTEPINLKDIEVGNGYIGPIYEVQIGDYKTGIIAYESPFHNCQIYTIGSFDAILTGQYTKHRVKEVLETIQYSMDKSRLVIDITNNSSYTSVVEDIFKDAIVFKQEYQNNTSSEMVMYMLKTIAIGYTEDDQSHIDHPNYDEYYNEDDDY